VPTVSVSHVENSSRASSFIVLCSVGRITGNAFA
jgi:hypothetical protein